MHRIPKNSSVIERLTLAPQEFNFVQAVCLLERANVFDLPTANGVATKPIAKAMPPSFEFVRFNANQTLAFSASDINRISIRQSDLIQDMPKQWQMSVNFIGLTGSNGVLPYHYSETALKRLKLKDPTMIAFFNLFNHRTTSLFYQAASKYNFAIDYQRHRLPNISKHAIDNQTRVLMSLIGLGTKHLADRLEIRDESLLQYAGLLTSKVKTAANLKQILESYFQVPVQINEFVGQWQALISDVRTRLPSQMAAGQNNQLGHSVMLGRHGWFAQGKINIILGPLNKSQLDLLHPSSNLLKSINEVVRFYLGFEHDYDFIMRLYKTDIPNQVALSKSSPTCLGWTSWLPSRTLARRSNGEFVDVPITVNKLS